MYIRTGRRSAQGKVLTPMPPKFRWGNKTFSDRIQISMEEAYGNC